MKKIFLSLVISIISVMCFGQTWNKITVEEDELKGTVGGEYYCYNDVKNDLTFFISNKENTNEKTGFFSSHKPHITIVCPKGKILDYHYNSIFCDDVVMANLGYYDDNNKLVKKTKAFFNRNNKGNDYGYNYGDYKKIFEYLTTKTGYIRLIIPIFNDHDLDIQIPCFNNK